jgi:hypothetical protein
MIPKEFKETLEIAKEYNSYLKEIELSVELLTNSNNGNEPQFSQDMLETIQKEFEESPEYRFEQKIKDRFRKEYKALNKSKTYFLGCELENYKKNYKSRLNSFQKDYKDSKEQDFVRDELEKLIHFSLPNYLDSKLLKSIGYSIERTKEYLYSILESQGFSISLHKNEDGTETLSITTTQKDLSIKKIDNSNLKWKAKPTHLVELGMALIESGSINVGKGTDELSEKKFYDLLADFFNVEILYHEKLKGDIRKRVKDETVFIPMLDNALKDSIIKRLE